MTMKLLLVLAGLSAIQGGVVTQDSSYDEPFINGVRYTKEVLKTGLKIPYFLSTDYNTNTLYLSLRGDVVSTTPTFAKINLDTNEYTEIDSYAPIVDETTHDVYINKRFAKGILKYNPNSNVSETYVANETIPWLFYFKHVLYFTDYPSFFLFTIADGKVTKYKELENSQVLQIAIDSDDNFFFFNKTGVYSLQNITKHVITYKRGAASVTSVGNDKKGNVYVTAEDGVYAVNKQKQSLEKILDIFVALGVASDSNNNIIYADRTSIVRLKPSLNQN